MTDIKEQIDELVDDINGLPTNIALPKKSELCNKVVVLLRAVVEECCRMDKPDPPVFASIHVARKRRHFAWLEEK